jgi:hypothetical protein
MRYVTERETERERETKVPSVVKSIRLKIVSTVRAKKRKSAFIEICVQQTTAVGALGDQLEKLVERKGNGQDRQRGVEGKGRKEGRKEG